MASLQFALGPRRDAEAEDEGASPVQPTFANVALDQIPFIDSSGGAYPSSAHCKGSLVLLGSRPNSIHKSKSRGTEAASPESPLQGNGEPQAHLRSSSSQNSSG